MTPFPTSIRQHEKQFVIYKDNLFFYSPYLTKTQTTSVKLSSNNILNHTEILPTNLKKESILYGPYEDISAFQYSPMYIHFENNRPFITITKLVREYEISHWGNLAVEDSFELQHDGAKLKGTFSRFDYQKSYNQAPAHVPVLREYLPSSAQDVYYRDEIGTKNLYILYINNIIGNISTSHLHYTSHYAQLDLIPRYPLFGGWKAGNLFYIYYIIKITQAFYMGYNLPLNEFLFKNSTHYILNVTFAPNMEDIVIDHLIIKVILPEGSK